MQASGHVFHNGWSILLIASWSISVVSHTPFCVQMIAFWRAALVSFSNLETSSYPTTVSYQLFHQLLFRFSVRNHQAAPDSDQVKETFRSFAVPLFQTAVPYPAGLLQHQGRQHQPDSCSFLKQPPGSSMYEHQRKSVLCL